VELPGGYSLEEVGGGVRLLKRPNGYMLTAFGSEVNPKDIQRVAEADKRYLAVKNLQGKFGFGADPESDLMFAQDIRNAREEYLLALEAAYRE
jgi:hypothetical protein